MADEIDLVIDEFATFDYEIDEQIGSGRYGKVFRAIRKSDRRVVAVKRLPICTLAERVRNHCYNEINLLRQLDHPNIIGLIDSFVDHRNQLNIVLELANIGDLRQLIKYLGDTRRLMFESKIWHLFSQICNAIEHMHMRKILHRDIKPDNVLLTATGNVKVADLGFGLLLDSSSTGTEEMIGSPFYMSPERLSNQQYDFKSDIWSLGCILYEMASSKPPFYTKDGQLCGLFRKAQESLYPPLPSATYSDDMCNLIAVCLEFQVSKRPTIDYVAAVASKHAIASSAA